MRVTLLTVGSRGDVQPYVALGTGLRAAGHAVAVATGPAFEPLVAQHGLEHRRLAVDYEGLMESPQARALLAGAPWRSLRFLRETVWPMLRQLLEDGWAAARDAELVVYHPKALAGYHVAEQLGVPGVLASPLPAFTPTAAFPSPLLPVGNLGGPLNRLTAALLLRVSTAPYRGLVNAWRRQALGLPPQPPLASELERDGQPVATLYGVSPHVVPTPADWPPMAIMTGYWFLDESAGYRPPPELERFLEAGEPPVYVGFGSMAGSDPDRTTRMVVRAVEQAGVRAILATGWGGLATRMPLPSSILAIRSAPHDWLFPRVAAVVHHGGAGTTAAGLRAGRPSVVCPFFGDQPFWGRRVHALGVGPAPIPQKRLLAERLAEAIGAATTDADMRRRAADLGEAIRGEDGIGSAVRHIDRISSREIVKRAQ